MTDKMLWLADRPPEFSDQPKPFCEDGVIRDDSDGVQRLIRCRRQR
ncbi:MULTISPECIES: hypothetical protein [Streptomyces]|nr:MULTISPECIES: hypothetical protein [Streptomyces]